MPADRGTRPIQVRPRLTSGARFPALDDSTFAGLADGTSPHKISPGQWGQRRVDTTDQSTGHQVVGSRGVQGVGGRDLLPRRRARGAGRQVGVRNVCREVRLLRSRAELPREVRACGAVRPNGIVAASCVSAADRSDRHEIRSAPSTRAVRSRKERRRSVHPVGRVRRSGVAYARRMSAIDDQGGWPAVLGALIAGDDLEAHVAGAAMTTILSGDATPAQIAGFVVAFRAKGETVDELAGMLDAAMAQRGDRAAHRATSGRSRSTWSVPEAMVRTRSTSRRWLRSSPPALELPCASTGTGRRRRSAVPPTCSICWASRSSSLPTVSQRASREVGIGFCFAPSFHARVPLRRSAASVRWASPTVFNLIGPMANPGRVRNQLIGVADPRFAATCSERSSATASTSAWVVHGEGLDELTTCGDSQVWELRDGGPTIVHRRPRRRRHRCGPAPADLRGGEPLENAEASAEYSPDRRVRIATSWC